MRADLKEFSNNTQNEHPMQYKDLETFLKDGVAALTKGPVATILVEDDVEIATTLRHHQHAGFASSLPSCLTLLNCRAIFKTGFTEFNITRHAKVR